MVGKLKICSTKNSAVCAGRDRRLTQVHEIGGALPENLDAEYAPGAAFAQQVQESRRLSRDVRAGDLAEIGASHYHVDFLGGCLRLRQPDAGDLGNGIHAGGHQTRGGGRLEPERREGCAPALVRCRARERRRPDCIARSIYPGDVGLETLVDLDVTARADSELHAVQTDAVEIGDRARMRRIRYPRSTCPRPRARLRPARSRRSAHP